MSLLQRAFAEHRQFPLVSFAAANKTTIRATNNIFLNNNQRINIIAVYHVINVIIWARVTLIYTLNREARQQKRAI